MSDIFYTEVDANLQKELLARAAAGRRNRTTKDINYMVSKIANVQITPYKVEYESKTKDKPDVVTKKTPISEATLGGAYVRQGEFLPTGPNGFLADRSIEKRDETDLDREGNAKTETITNTSKRIPPYLTGVEIQIGDDSMGIMQNATVNVTIPNPGRDLEYFESIYLRPGRNVKIYIEHPKTAIVSEDTNGFLTDKTMPSTEKIKSLYPEIADKDILKYKRMNSYVFDGVITSFTLDYQEDTSIAASLTMRGTSQVYTDVSMAMNDAGKKDETDAQKTVMKTFYEKIDKDVEEQINNTDSGFYIDESSEKNKDISYIWGPPYTGEPRKRYISLKALIEFINKYIITKTTPVVGDANIVFDRTVNTSKYYELLVSADPENIFFPGQDDYKSQRWYGKLESKKYWWYEKLDTGESVTYTTLIYISMEYIQNTLTAMVDAETYTVNELLKRVSSLIYNASGGAYQMSLITHPEMPNALLYYDSNNVKSFSNVAKEFPIPMFANDEVGTIVKSFNFNGKLPSDASNLAYVLNQDPAEISESEIAPFLSYMYSAKSVSRKDGTEITSNIVNTDTLKQVQEKYKQRHTQYVNELTGSLDAFGKEMKRAETKSAFRTSLKKYIQYPKPELENTNQLKAPVIPFDASFVIEGINGFRYGDVLQFKGLPSRYTQNTVFSIISISHSVTADGEWTTSIQCIMRPRIE